MSLPNSKEIPAKKGGFGAALAADLPASLVVFLVALPLSLGIALASGAPLMAGLIAAIIGGVVVGLAGGAPLQVSGPAAGLTVIVYGLIQQYGWGVTCAITVGAGILQIVLGAMGVAPVALGMSPAVIHAMLAAIGILIAISQMHVVLGHAPSGKGIKNLLHLPESFMALDAGALILGLLTIGILVGWAYLPSAKLRSFPAALAAVVLGTAASLLFGMNVPRVQFEGTIFSALQLPIFPTENVGGILGAILGLTIVASAESLLCAVATDKLHTGPRANLNKELVGQGVGNTLSGLVGGLPITGVIVRSTANINAGGKTRLSAIFHGVWVLLFVTLLPGVIMKVPLAVLAGLLVYTGFKLVNMKHIKELRHHGELPIYLITLFAIVGIDLLVGLGIGFCAAALRLLWKLTHVDIHVEGKDQEWLVTVDGTLTFAGVPRLTSRLATLPAGSSVSVDLAVRFMDHAGYEALNSWRMSHELMGGTVRLDGLDEIWTRSKAREARKAGTVTGTAAASKPAAAPRPAVPVTATTSEALNVTPPVVAIRRGGSGWALQRAQVNRARVLEGAE